jgi:putative FmdB family regulatory protein
MTYYEFYCEDCDFKFETTNRHIEECVICKKRNIRRIWNTTFILKGSGFYKNDSKQDAV